MYNAKYKSYVTQDSTQRAIRHRNDFDFLGNYAMCKYTIHKAAHSRQTARPQTRSQPPA